MKFQISIILFLTVKKIKAIITFKREGFMAFFLEIKVL